MNYNYYIRMEGPSNISMTRYQYNLNRLKSLMGIEDESLKWLKNTKKVIDFIDALNYSLNYKKSFYIAIVSLLKLQKTLKKELEIYRAKQLSYNTEQAKIYDEQVLSPSEEDKFMSWPDIIKAAKQMEPGSEDHLIVSLYTLLPPLRNDFAKMKVVSELPENPSGNYLVLSPKTSQIVLTEFKTARKYGTQTIDVPAKLNVIIKKYLKNHPTDVLFNATESHISNKIGNVFEKLLGKRTTINILRHSYISYMKRNEPTLKKKEALAKSMMHSISMDEVYRKVNI
jgi:hypothetical protein